MSSHIYAPRAQAPLRARRSTKERTPAKSFEGPSFDFSRSLAHTSGYYSVLRDPRRCSLQRAPKRASRAQGSLLLRQRQDKNTDLLLHAEDPPRYWKQLLYIAALRALGRGENALDATCNAETRNLERVAVSARGARRGARATKHYALRAALADAAPSRALVDGVRQARRWAGACRATKGCAGRWHSAVKRGRVRRAEYNNNNGLSRGFGQLAFLLVFVVSS